ncbi:MAG: sensor histidine kinase, partial [Elusimicrobia bacterium]|nr:sensor histidine kinase [Elusimicrobiota bacterium]
LAHAKKFRAKGPVRVAAAAEAGGVALTVSFLSLPVPEDARPLMLDLYQPAAAREGRGTSCVGLGLGFAKRLAEMHGGTLDFALADDGGCRMTLRVPGRRAP